MIEVNLCAAPVGDLVGLAVPRDQGLALFFQEDLQGLAMGGAVDEQPATSRHQRAASERSWVRSRNLLPLKNRSRAYRAFCSTLGL